MQIATVVPVKAFSAAKQRLSGTLTEADRADLARWMAEQVIGAAAGTRVFVACDDETVRAWADDLGAEICWGPGLGLDGAVDDAVGHVVAVGADHVIVSHADLPAAGELAAVARPGWATLVPDARLDGTNVMAFPSGRPIRAGYGPGSFRRHLARARELGPTEVRVDAALGLDVDVPDHLHHPRLREALRRWRPTTPDNRPRP